MPQQVAVAERPPSLAPWDIPRSVPGLPNRGPNGYAIVARARPLTERGRVLGGRGVPSPTGRSSGASVLPPAHHAAAHAAASSDWSQAWAELPKAPPPTNGQAGRAWRRRAGPPSCQLQGRPGGRALAGYFVACSRALPLASCGEVGAARAAAVTVSSPPGSVPPVGAPRSSEWPRVGSWESPRRRRVVVKPC